MGARPAPGGRSVADDVRVDRSPDDSAGWGGADAEVDGCRAHEAPQRAGLSGDGRQELPNQFSGSGRVRSERWHRERLQDGQAPAVRLLAGDLDLPVVGLQDGPGYTYKYRAVQKPPRCKAPPRLPASAAGAACTAAVAFTFTQARSPYRFGKDLSLPDRVTSAGSGSFSFKEGSGGELD